MTSVSPPPPQPCPRRPPSTSPASASTACTSSHRPLPPSTSTSPRHPCKGFISSLSLLLPSLRTASVREGLAPPEVRSSPVFARHQPSPPRCPSRHGRIEDCLHLAKKKLKLQEESEEMREEGKEEYTQSEIEEEKGNEKDQRVYEHTSEEDEVYVWPNGNRSRTHEEWARYDKQIKESEGFDVDPFLGTCEFGLTAITDFDDEILIRCTKLAIEHFNKENDMSYVFVKIEKATCSVAAGLWYYVTFQAVDGEAEPKIFQAKVFYGVQRNIRVALCRLKPTASRMSCSTPGLRHSGAVCKSEPPSPPSLRTASVPEALVRSSPRLARHRRLCSRSPCPILSPSLPASAAAESPLSCPFALTLIAKPLLLLKSDPPPVFARHPPPPPPPHCPS
uniref:Cystatin domain-containing protein n=1 Tax=Ananas comosus var. bracteatus TaxID=296719 RepID=A0A6V7P4U6_ANACO|nr:unnamed protein product [Ananas comosus var. bracteatus]